MRAIQHLTAQARPGKKNKKKNTCDGVAVD